MTPSAAVDRGARGHHNENGAPADRRALAAAILLIVQGIRGFPVNQDFKAALKENAAVAAALRTGIPADLARMDRDIKNLSLILNLAPLIGKWYYIAVGAAAFAGVMALLAPRTPPAE